MAGWEEELAVLLRELGVKQEEPQTRLRSSRKPMRRSTGKFADALFRPDANSTNENDDWIDDLDVMRREVNSIVSQVVTLMQTGDLDASFKEDVLIVLHALRRRAMVTRQAAISDEAYLESASAMLHFCRLVIRLSELATEDL